MPELPEVETTCKGITPHVLNKKIMKVIIRAPKLRWPIPKKISTILPGNKILAVERRAKYMLLKLDQGTLIIHLGMSGTLRTLTERTKPAKHDHVDIEFEDGTCLRYNDPRRFGCILWTQDAPESHKLLKDLGPEPFSKEFTGKYLSSIASKRSVPVKNFIMDNKVVVGAGNIYANEALFAAGINPLAPANSVPESKYMELVKHIKAILKLAIKKGGTTLKDFRDSDGKPGYFSQKLKIYGKSGEPCVECKTPIETVQIGQRSSYYCPSCQP